MSSSALRKVVMPDTDPSLSLHRFGVGARPGELAKLTGNPKGFLKDQLGWKNAALIENPGLPSSAAAAQALASAEMMKRAGKADGATPVPEAPAAAPAIGLLAGDPGSIRRSVYEAEVMARFGHGVATEVGFVERLVLFWANHFAVSVDKGPVHVLAGALEREAIRPHVLGRFADLLKAVEEHPAMLVFLDNQQSVGPASKAGSRTGKGLNENRPCDGLAPP